MGVFVIHPCVFHNIAIKILTLLYLVQRHSCVVFVDSIIVVQAWYREYRGGVSIEITGGIRVKRNSLILISSNPLRTRNRNIRPLRPSTTKAEA